MKRILYSFLMVTALTAATTLAWAEDKVANDRDIDKRTEGASTEATYTGGCEDCRKSASGCTLKDPRAACQPAKPNTESQSAAPSGVKGTR